MQRALSSSPTFPGMKKVRLSTCWHIERDLSSPLTTQHHLPQQQHPHQQRCFTPVLTDHRRRIHQHPYRPISYTMSCGVSPPVPPTPPPAAAAVPQTKPFTDTLTDSPTSTHHNNTHRRICTRNSCLSLSLTDIARSSTSARRCHGFDDVTREVSRRGALQQLAQGATLVAGELPSSCPFQTTSAFVSGRQN